ncbi:MAG: Sua5/YciO/YrdC/YwlC family protein, partial [Burkholderiales bacterium]|nr:Sua5/YciO/YrdC/YwlC family protein [Burkholderiales bacterium]
LAVRVSKHKLINQLCNYLTIPLVSTSANKSSCVAIKNYRQCLRQFACSVLVLPGTTLFAKKPSTVINLKTKQVLR